MTSYWWVSTPSGTFAIVARDGKVIDCAPWAKRSAMGRPIDDVLAKYRKLRGTMVVALHAAEG